MFARWHKSDVEKIQIEILYGGGEDPSGTLRHLFPDGYAWFSKRKWLQHFKWIQWTHI